ncbi:hypothetical protein AGMMS50212_00740 [Spirochaetia bacterium]|nr:hypothetical protein AGMMS50212_00740 [Spirochaetia bacterium]
MIKTLFTRGVPKILVLSAVFLSFWTISLSAIDIDKTELGKSQGKVEFENNPNVVNNGTSVEQIRAIGKALANALFDNKGNRKQNIIVGDTARYSLEEIYDISTTDADGLSADIIMLGKQAGVDTISNLRYILSGYIETAYRYPQNVADEIAIYVTVYNAINRKNFDRFNEFYKKEVVKYLNGDTLGLSPSFRDWPGGTQIIIPLYDPDADGNMQIELKEVVNKEVVEAIKKEPVKGADPQKFNPAPPPPTKAQLLAKAKTAAEKAENELREYERALEAAKQKALQERTRQKTLEEDLLIAQGEYEKANINVVRNKFGEPIVGNEASKAKAAEIELIKKALGGQGGRIKTADNNVALAEKNLEDARAALEQRKIEAALLQSQ